MQNNQDPGDGTRPNESVNKDEVEKINEDNQEHPFENVLTKSSKKRLWQNRIKICFICFYWLILTVLLMSKEEMEHTNELFVLPINKTGYFNISLSTDSKIAVIYINGPFVIRKDTRKFRKGDVISEIKTVIQYVTYSSTGEPLSQISASDKKILEFVDEDLFDSVDYIVRKIYYHIDKSVTPPENSQAALTFDSNVNVSTSLSIHYEKLPLPTALSTFIAILLLVNFHFLLFSDLVERLIAAILISTLSIAMVAQLHMRPTLHQTLLPVDVSVLMEIFGFSIIVKKFYQTGILDYIAVRLYELANGHIWPMLNLVCMITFAWSIVLGNIVLIMFLTPILLRICEIMHLNPTPTIICVIISANIGAGLTTSGDEVNSQIMTSGVLTGNDLTIRTYLMHMMPGVALAAFQSYCQMRLVYYNSDAMRYTDSDDDVERLRRAIRVWKHTAKSMPIYTQKEKYARDTVFSQIAQFRKRFGRLGKMPTKPSHFDTTIDNLRVQYPIQDRLLLIKCSIVLITTLILICLQSFTHLIDIKLGWIALLGAALLLLLADETHMEGLLVRVEWTIMLIFICMYIIAANLNLMGVPDFIKPVTLKLIDRVAPENQLLVTVLALLWGSAFSSAFLGKITVVPAMMNTVAAIYYDDNNSLPLLPLVWAVAFGSCFGGNGTLIANFSNLLCVKIAENRGYLFYFFDFFKIGFPIMIGNLIVTSIYMTIVHIYFEWHD